MILGSSREDSLVADDTELNQERRIAAIEAVMQWLLSFFHD